MTTLAEAQRLGEQMPTDDQHLPFERGEHEVAGSCGAGLCQYLQQARHLYLRSAVDLTRQSRTFRTVQPLITRSPMA